MCIQTLQTVTRNLPSPPTAEELARAAELSAALVALRAEPRKKLG
jgi:hypothetical protein